jgi:uncharacterized protein
MIMVVKSRPYVIGSALGIMNALLTTHYLANRPIGASTSYPYFAGLIFKLQESQYFAAVKNSGSWELVFLVGTFIGAMCAAFVVGRFRVKCVPELWKEKKGNSAVRRLSWAFVGGFALILGARLAGGCTSGHILSGGMELALSSILFAFFCIGSAVVSARLFYGGDR